MSAINKINVDNVSYNIEDSRVDNIADSIPTASTEQKGLVQVGQGINVDENGVISVEGGSGGDSVSYTDVGNVTNPVTIGLININGTDYNIDAPAAYYNNYVSGQSTAVGQINSGSVLGSQEIFVPAVMYEDQIQGSHVLGQLVVGGDSYPITYTPAASGDSVQFNSLLASGTQIGTITINGVDTAIYAPAGGSGSGSTVSYQDLTSPSDARVAVGMITIDGAGYNIYVPTTVAVDWNDITGKPYIPAVIGDVSGLAVTPDLSSGTKIASISWTDSYGENIQDIYAPAGGSGSTDWSDIQNKPNVVKNIRIQSSYEGMGGTEVATVTWDDDNGDNIATIYAPNGGSSSVDWFDVQNKPAIQPGSKGMNSICQGGNNATGDFSIAIGYDTKATKHCAVAVGGSTRSSGMWSVATGDGTIAAGNRQIAAGTYNAEDANDYFAFMVGNGDYNGGSTIRKNAEATAWNGNKYIEGNLYVNCNSWTTRPSSDTVSGKPELVTTNAGGVRVATLTDLAGIGGDTVTVTQTLTSGTKIAEIDVSGTTTSLYAPASAADNITNDEIKAWNNAVNYEEQQSVKFTSSEEFSITIAINGHPWNGELWYSDNNGNIWKPIDKTRASITITSQSGDLTNNQHQLMLRGTDNTFITGNETTVSSGWNTFSLTATSGVYGSGNIMALLDYRTANTNKVITRGRAFYGLFRSWTLLHTAPALPATTLSEACYGYMFTDDNVLEVAPELPATKLVTDCYGGMFSGCVSLREAPDLPATKLASGCYASMFYGCTRLVKAPKLPATTLADSCYNRMFGNCTALKVPPELPATELATGCYASMFSSCTALIALPVLRATVLPDSCYKQMFYECTAITFQDSSSSEASIAYKIPDSTAAGSEGTDSLKQMFSPMYSGNISRYTTYYVSGVARFDVTYDDYAYKPGDCVYYIEPITYIRDTVTSTGTPAPVTQLAVSRALEAYRADWNAGSGQGTILNKPAIKAGTGTEAIIEGYATTASGNYSHAEGHSTTASGMYCHAEGLMTQAAGFQSHAEGYQSIASGTASHAEGEAVKAIGDYSHAEGYYSWASSWYSHAEGWNTRASSQTQHVQGKFNVEDINGVFADIVGNGSGMAGAPRSNAEATDWNGNKYLSGGIYVGCTDYTTTANGLTTLGAGGFRIDMAPAEKEAEVENPTEPESMTSEDFVMIDTITKTMGSEMQEDPETGDQVQVPTTVTTAHQRSWTRLPKEYSIRDLAGDVGSLGGMNPPDDSFNDGGIYTLQIWSVKSYEDDGEGNMIAVYTPEYRWVKTAETTPEDAEEPTK